MSTRLALFGAPPDTPNMGVSALFMSTVAGITEQIGPVEFIVFDNGLGERESNLRLPSGAEIKLLHFGARGGKRYYRPENLATMHAASKLGAIGPLLNKGIRLLDSCDAVLDVSGGDSFSDIYGRSRFNNVYRPKAIAINRGKPLILLPQTYGPYRDHQVRAMAATAVCGAGMAWARDQHSYQILRDLLGENFNPDIHRCGVDMAFGLPSQSASNLLPQALDSLLGNKSSDTPLVGFNVSGLIYNDPEAAVKKYGFKADYREIVTEFLRKILTETSAYVILISHVMDRPGHYESDLGACNDVARQLGESHANRVIVAPATMDQSQVKWLIAQMDWFCGTRMHSTIASLSSGVATAAISYSDKTMGVFQSCGQHKQVIDPRNMNTSEAVSGLFDAYENREQAKKILIAQLRDVMNKIDAQMKSIVSFIHTVSAMTNRCPDVNGNF